MDDWEEISPTEKKDSPRPPIITFGELKIKSMSELDLSGVAGMTLRREKRINSAIDRIKTEEKKLWQEEGMENIKNDLINFITLKKKEKKKPLTLEEISDYETAFLKNLVPVAPPHDAGERFPFGKYKGEKIEHIKRADRSYCICLKRQSWIKHYPQVLKHL